MKILIVDDDAISRKLIVKGLEKAGYDTLEADNPSTAIGLLEGGEPIVLVITDVMMPGMSGLDFLAHIRSTPSLARLPVIICTVLTNESVRDRADAFGIADFVPKPINISVLREKVVGTLDAELQPLSDLHHTLERLDVEADAYFGMLGGLGERLSSATAEMQERVAQRDSQGLSSCISSLWGAAQNLGAERLANVLGRQTQASDKGDLGAVQSMIAEVQREAAILQAETAYLRREYEQVRLSRSAGTAYFRARRHALAAHAVPSPKPVEPPTAS